MLGSASAVSFMQHTSELKLTFEIASKSTVIKKKKSMAACNCYLLETGHSTYMGDRCIFCFRSPASYVLSD